LANPYGPYISHYLDLFARLTLKADTLLRIDGVTRRRADSAIAVRPGVPVRPLAERKATSFRMIKPLTQPKPVSGPGIPGDLHLVSRMSDRNVSCRVLSLTPFQGNELKQHPSGQAVTSGWVRSLFGQRENHS
jgi:hypothetical protein